MGEINKSGKFCYWDLNYIPLSLPKDFEITESKDLKYNGYIVELYPRSPIRIDIYKAENTNVHNEVFYFENHSTPPYKTDLMLSIYHNFGTIGDASNFDWRKIGEVQYHTTMDDYEKIKFFCALLDKLDEFLSNKK